MLRYLPLQAGRWNVAVPLEAVVEVRAFLDSEPSPVAQVHDAHPHSPVGLPTLSLSAIFGDPTEGERIKYGIVIKCHAGVFCLLVEDIMLLHTADSIDPLPLILQATSQLISHVIRMTDHPILLLDVEQVGQIVYRAAAQEIKNGEE